MNKLMTVALSSTALLAAGAAVAFEPTGFYVGADANYTHLHPTATLKAGTVKFKNHKFGANLALGGKFHENFGAEVGYSWPQKYKGQLNNTGIAGLGLLGIAPSNGNFSYKVHNVYLDLVGYYPASCEVDLLASVGLGRTKVKEEINGKAGNIKVSKSGLRGRIGAQYKFDENFAARFMVGYQKGVKKAAGIKHTKTAGVGVTYIF